MIFRKVVFTPEQHDVWKAIDKEISNSPGRLTMATYVCSTQNTVSLETMDCGTSACIAGWAALVTGQSLKSLPGVGWGLEVTGIGWNLEYYAQQKLGLSHATGYNVFYSSDARGRKIVKFAAEHGYLPLNESHYVELEFEDEYGDF